MTKIDSTNQMLKLMNTSSQNDAKVSDAKLTHDVLDNKHDSNEKELQLTPGPSMLDLLNRCLKQNQKPSPTCN
jgi:hypothetical protein